MVSADGRNFVSSRSQEGSPVKPGMTDGSEPGMTDGSEPGMTDRSGSEMTDGRSGRP